MTYVCKCNWTFLAPPHPRPCSYNVRDHTRSFHPARKNMLWTALRWFKCSLSMYLYDLDRYVMWYDNDHRKFFILTQRGAVAGANALSSVQERSILCAWLLVQAYSMRRNRSNSMRICSNGHRRCHSKSCATRELAEGVGKSRKQMTHQTQLNTVKQYLNVSNTYEKIPNMSHIQTSGRRKGVPIHEDGMDWDAWLGSDMRLLICHIRSDPLWILLWNALNMLNLSN